MSYQTQEKRGMNECEEGKGVGEGAGGVEGKFKLELLKQFALKWSFGFKEHGSLLCTAW